MVCFPHFLDDGDDDDDDDVMMWWWWCWCLEPRLDDPGLTMSIFPAPFATCHVMNFHPPNSKNPINQCSGENPVDLRKQKPKLFNVRFKNLCFSNWPSQPQFLPGKNYSPTIATDPHPKTPFQKGPAFVGFVSLFASFLGTGKKNMFFFLSWLVGSIWSLKSSKVCVTGIQSTTANQKRMPSSPQRWK